MEFTNKTINDFMKTYDDLVDEDDFYSDTVIKYYDRVGNKFKRNKNCPPVLCLKTGKIYKNISDASHQTGAYVKTIRAHCMDRIPGEKKWCYKK